MTSNHEPNTRNEPAEPVEANLRVVYLMRGLPGCGKSHMARRLAGQNGIVLETDQFFYTQVGSDPASYDYDKSLLDAARQWNLDRFRAALARGMSPIVVDRGNGVNPESRQYVHLALERAYDVQLREPDSEWWQELRVLLKFKQYVADELFDQWANQLSAATRDTHRVPAATIRHWMRKWRHGITVDDILEAE